MATVKIKSINMRSILSDADYNYIVDNLDKDLPLMCINYTPTGKVFSIAVYKGDSDCVTLFVDTNKLTYEIKSPINDAISMLVERKEIVKNIHSYGEQSYVHGLMAGRLDEISILISMLSELNK